MSEQLKENLTKQSTWIRALYMLVFILIYGVVKVIVAAVVAYQLASNLLLAKSNEKLVSFSANMSSYIYEVVRFLMFCTEEKPFPFADWPGEERKKTVKKRKTQSKKTGKSGKELDATDSASAEDDGPEGGGSSAS